MGLSFHRNFYERRIVEIAGTTLRYRAYEGIPYMERPEAPELQVMNIYIPEDSPYVWGKLPIFLPNTVGGYMPGMADTPKVLENGEGNAIVQALLRGYMVAAPGLRGRGMQNDEGDNIGMAPAAICDYKAAVRFLRHVKEDIPGDTERIISNGTSAGGALSALLGTTGNHPDYEPYLLKMGAAAERDDIFLASCYCPIINLEHADMAYEWEFYGRWDCYQGKYMPPEHEGEEGKWVPVVRQMTEEQKQLSEQLRSMFPAYVESLGLVAKNGVPLLLSEEGGTLQKLLCEYILESANQALAEGEDLSGFAWILAREKEAVAMDYSSFVKFRTRMKDTPAFDKLTLESVENELFGSVTEDRRHFTEFAREQSQDTESMAEPEQIKMMNPMEYITDTKAVKAKQFVIRHGAIDRDTSLYIPLLFATALKNQGIEADLAFPWGKWHMGDYELDALFNRVEKMK